ncbi:acetoacetate decarboxylase [Methylobacterium variabile]|jgi:acetoacetate decarboxylase|uniref:Acetoacetate decarboxylase n=1 Tax=Methylobacterium variabile TaxID=298794 RepID=A0A0J6TAA3_9HYPH|nr:acetoacetate decarboxylase [Methylobacterium variabile]KMO42824.1 acetoacetate decarboxylase [Methylobacterium variabile]
MTRDEILSAPSMPAFSPSYPHGPYRFIRREYLIITYETDPDALRAALPEPLEPAPGNLAYYEWMKMPDSSGFGDYEESGSAIVATYNGEPCNYSVQMYLDDEPPITAGREIWGFPKKYGVPRLKLTKDTLTGTLHYDDERVAMGTMTYKHRSLEDQLDKVRDGIGQLNVNLKLIPDVDGGVKVAQLVGYRLQDIRVHGAWEGEARLHLIPHVNCRVADLPVRRIVRGRHQIVDFTLPYGHVLHDYLA